MLGIAKTFKSISSKWTPCALISSQIGISSPLKIYYRIQILTSENDFTFDQEPQKYQVQILDEDSRAVIRDANGREEEASWTMMFD